MHLTADICGAIVEARSDGSEVLIQVGDTTLSPAEIGALSTSQSDWTATATVGGFVFDATALGALQQLAAAACLAAEAERGSFPRA